MCASVSSLTCLELKYCQGSGGYTVNHDSSRECMDIGIDIDRYIDTSKKGKVQNSSEY